MTVDPAAGRRVPKRVRDEVGEDLADADGVDLDDRQVALDVGGQVHPGGRRRRLERADDVGDEEVRVGRLAMERQRAGLGQGQRPQVVDEPAEDSRLVEDRARGGPRSAG